MEQINYQTYIAIYRTQIHLVLEIGNVVFAHSNLEFLRNKSQYVIKLNLFSNMNMKTSFDQTFHHNILNVSY